MTDTAAHDEARGPSSRLRHGTACTRFLIDAVDLWSAALCAALGRHGVALPRRRHTAGRSAPQGSGAQRRTPERCRARGLLAPAASRFLGLALVAAVGCASAALGQRPVDVATYLTGAWGRPRTETERALYLKGGFTMAPYDKHNAEWGVEHGLQFIGGVSSWGLPTDVARPFESADGSQSMSVGLFTHINFNAPSVEAWWRATIPGFVRDMPHADRIAFWKVHNEFGYHAGPIYDYSPGSLARYRAWLSTRYGTVAELNRRWRTRHADFAAVQPPRTREEMNARLANWLEWRRFTCWNFADYFRTTGDLIRSVVPNARVSDNFYSTSPLQGWDNFELARQTDYMAYDIYSAGRWPRLLELLEHARCAAAAWNKPFLMMEYHAGPNHWAPLVTGRDLTIEASVALARECRALQWYMWRPGGGGREQGIHGMLDSQGRPTERYTAVAKVSAFTQRLAPLLLSARTETDIAVVTSVDNAFLAYAQRGDIWKDRRRWDTLCRILAAGRFQVDQVDPTWLLQGDLSRYRVLILGHLPILGDAVLVRVRGFAEAGGTVLMHPDTGSKDDLGHPRDGSPFGDATGKENAWTTRSITGFDGSVRVEGTGRGRTVTCGWELPEQHGDDDLLSRRASDYTRLLMEHTDARPKLALSAGASPTQIDAKRLRAGPATVLVLTSLGTEGIDSVHVRVPGLSGPKVALLLTPQSASAERLPVEQEPEGCALTVPRLDPAALILLTDSWQPLVGIDLPGTLFRGQEVAGSVTIDNVGAEAVTGEAELVVPEGWQAEFVKGASFPALAPGGRSTLAVRIRVPAAATLDRFAIEHPITARATFSAGRSGVLSARHLPFVLPALDLRIRYEGRLINPWQEMTPEIMRWGWQNELRTPPPPPLACRADTPVSLELTAGPSLAGTVVRLHLTGPGAPSITPDGLKVSAERGTHTVALRLPQPGDYVLHARAGDAETEVAIRAGVHTETVRTAMAASPGRVPPGWTPVARLGTGIRQAAARGTPVLFEDESLAGPQPDRQLAVFDAAGKPVACCLAGGSVLAAVDAPINGVACLLLASAPAAAAPAVAPPRIRLERDEGEGMVVSGDAYSVSFDTDLGLVRWLAVRDRQVAPHRTGLVARLPDGDTWAPDGRACVRDLAVTASPVRATLEFSRLLGPAEAGIVARETWTLEPARIAVQASVVNEGRKPVTFAALTYELGISPQLFPQWRRTLAEGHVQSGVLPQGFGPARGALCIDWHNSAGAGIALTLGRCALATKFQSGFAGTRHSARCTSIEMLRNVRLDPGDRAFAEFEIWPHDQALAVAGNPVVVPVVSPVE